MLKVGMRDRETRSKVIVTMLGFLIYQLGTFVMLPGVDLGAVKEVSKSTLVRMLDMFGGGSLTNLSVFALGLSPYITAMLLVQLLQKDIVPILTEWGRQGAVGQKKLKNVTRGLALVFGVLQSVALVAGFGFYESFALVKSPKLMDYFLVGGCMMLGLVVLMVLSAWIDKKGLGNGTSVIILAGILSGLVVKADGLLATFRGEVTNTFLLYSLGYFVVLLLVAYVVTYIHQGERRLEIRKVSKSGESINTMYLPLKLNISGVAPVIFAGMFMSLTQIILGMFSKDNAIVKELMEYVSLYTYKGIGVYFVIIVAFAFIYTHVQFDTMKVAENLQKSESYISGVKPGLDTENYLNKVVNRLTTLGGLGLALLVCAPLLISRVYGLNDLIGFSGTSLLIITSVWLDLRDRYKGMTLKGKYEKYLG